MSVEHSPVDPSAEPLKRLKKQLYVLARWQSSEDNSESPIN